MEQGLGPHCTSVCTHDDCTKYELLRTSYLDDICKVRFGLGTCSPGCRYFGLPSALPAGLEQPRKLFLRFHFIKTLKPSHCQSALHLRPIIAKSISNSPSRLSSPPSTDRATDHRLGFVDHHPHIYNYSTVIMPGPTASYSISIPASPPPPSNLTSYSRFIHEHTKRQMESFGAVMSPGSGGSSVGSTSSTSLSNGVSHHEYHS